MCMRPAGGILQQSWQAQLLELEARLARSAAAWKLVVGHHPARAQLQVLGHSLLPLLRAPTHPQGPA